MKLEVGKKYTNGHEVLEVKFFDYEGTAWCLSDKTCCIYLPRDHIGWHEVIDKPDPGEGWRLLEVGERLQKGDQVCKDTNDWVKANLIYNDGIVNKDSYFRRRIAPQYVPYTWEDREELRGRWLKRKVKDTYEHERLAWRFDLVDGYFYVDSTRSDELLNEWVWLDGSPCGKKV